MNSPAVGLCLASLAALTACLERPVADPEVRLSSAVQLPVPEAAVDKVDLLFAVDNSGSMRDNQANLARNFGVLIDRLVDPPLDPITNRRQHPPVRSMHVGVVSSDLGTPGTAVPSCVNTDVGDDGILNPIRNGLSLRAHPPWMNAPEGVRPRRCESRGDQYPSFLDFSADTTDAQAFREDFVCNAFLSVGGCGLEQQLESAYRALVIRNARAGVAGNRDPNAGFVRDDAVLAVVMVTDEEDGSVRDCRYAEPGDPDGVCRPGGPGSALGVFDVNDTRWAGEDLNLRFYLYQPGGAQDPTWPLNRYIDPRNPARGFTSLKPGHPERVIFAAIAGVPINLPQVVGSTDPRDPANIDWAALLGSSPDGADGYVGSSPEGPISMRQRNSDGPRCPARVVPACRREGSPHDAVGCDTTRQYFAWPSRRVAEVARRFAATHGTGAITSICRNDYSEALGQVVDLIGRGLVGRCLPRVLDTTPRTPAPGAAVMVNCVVREALPGEVSAASWCVPARGRRPGGRDANGRETCLVSQLPVVPGQRPAAGEGFFYDTTPSDDARACPQRISFTQGAALAPGATGAIECVQSQD